MFRFPSPCLALVACALPLLTGCTETEPLGPDALAPAVHAAQDVEVTLRPQPEPPGAFRFVFLMQEDGDEWFGTFGDGTSSCGIVELTDTETTPTGEVTHVSFGLRLVTHDASWQVNADVSGIVNAVNGLMVLNGEAVSGSLFRGQVHQQGRIVQSVGDDPDSFLGEVMLRPQPEPPGRSGTPQFPPNPC